MGYGCQEVRKRHEGVGKQRNGAIRGKATQIGIQLPPPPLSLVRVKYPDNHSTQHCPCLVCISEQESQGAGTEQGKPPGSHLLCSALPMEPSTPLGGMEVKIGQTFQVSFVGQCNYDPLFAQNCQMPRKVVSPSNLTSQLKPHRNKHRQEKSKSVDCSNIHPAFFLLFFKKKVCGLKCKEKYL